MVICNGRVMRSSDNHMRGSHEEETHMKCLQVVL